MPSAQSTFGFRGTVTRFEFPPLLMHKRYGAYQGKMSLRLILIIILATSCSRTKETPAQTANDSTADIELSENVKAKEQTFNLRVFRDTTLNGVTLKFIELTDKDYNSLSQQIKETGIPLQSTSDLVSKVDSCLLVKLDNKKTDSLCNKRQGDNFEEYNFNGLWKEKGLVLVSYQDWEGGSDFFINLKDGGYYYLTHNYKVSPDLKHIFSFVELNETAFIPSGLMLTECDNGAISTKLNIEFDRVIITSLSWLTNDQCLISAGSWDKEKFSVSDLRNFKLSLSYD
ncbi:MAG: hypothetical protein ABL895_08915 [Cyclobacteriaceae bacterium]